MWGDKMKKKPVIVAISGVKNSGKTTLIEAMIPYLKKEGFRVAVIKHDGHEFEPDVSGTDSYRFYQAGAEGTAVYSDRQFMIVKRQNANLDTLLSMFEDVDIILLEGQKNSLWSKIEVVRSEINEEPVCDTRTVLAYVSDCHLEKINSTGKIPVFSLDASEQVAKYILRNFI